MAEPPLSKRLEQSLDFLSPLMPERPRAGIITGTGLSHLPEGMAVEVSRPYSEIPHFPHSTVESHAGELIYGRIGNVPIIIFQGRFHLYEGYTPDQVVYPVRLLQAMGVKRILLNNAAGGVGPGFNTGDIMVIFDHINLTGANPLVGPNDDALGLRFPDMTRVYSQHWQERAFALGDELGIALRRGIYAGLRGPSLETPAETRYLKIIGAHAVGFSTVMEAIAAVHAKMEILGLSLITNINDPDHPEPATLESVLAAARSAAPAMDRLMGALVKDMA